MGSKRSTSHEVADAELLDQDVHVLVHGRLQAPVEAVAEDEPPVRILPLSPAGAASEQVLDLGLVEQAPEAPGHVHGVVARVEVLGGDLLDADPSKHSQRHHTRTGEGQLGHELEQVLRRPAERRQLAGQQPAGLLHVGDEPTAERLAGLVPLLCVLPHHLLGDPRGLAASRGSRHPPHRGRAGTAPPSTSADPRGRPPARHRSDGQAGPAPSPRHAGASRGGAPGGRPPPSCAARRSGSPSSANTLLGYSRASAVMPVRRPWLRWNRSSSAMRRRASAVLRTSSENPRIMCRSAS